MAGGSSPRVRFGLVRAFLWRMKTQRKTRKLVSLVAVLVLHLSGVSIANAEVFSTISVTGRVLPAFRLEADQPTAFDPNVIATAIQSGPNTVVVEVTVLGSTEAVRVKVPLRMRTNADNFALRASFQGLGVDGSVSLDQPQAAGNGTLVMPGALAAFRTQPTRLAPDNTLAVGSRISMRGSFRSPNNALLSTMEISFAPMSRSETQTFRFHLTMEAQ